MPRKTGGNSSDSRSRPQPADEGPALRRARFLDGIKEIDPNDYDLLRKFLTEHGKIVPARLSGASAKQQRKIRGLVRRLRVMGVLP